jgi:hypothetical protein
MVLLAQRYNASLAAPAVAAPVFSSSRIGTSTRREPVVKSLDIARRKPGTPRPTRRDARAG